MLMLLLVIPNDLVAEIVFSDKALLGTIKPKSTIKHTADVNGNNFKYLFLCLIIVSMQPVPCL